MSNPNPDLGDKKNMKGQGLNLGDIVDVEVEKENE